MSTQQQEQESVLSIRGMKLASIIGRSQKTYHEPTWDPVMDAMVTAVSSCGDMVLDDERNAAFKEAIRYSVKKLVQNTDNKMFYCLDIGTGTGLLSMMIVDAFKNLSYDNFHVIAFESYLPMKTCAEKTIEKNGMSENITVIGEDVRYRQCVNQRFDLIVAELLDTELIGEGCLPIYDSVIEHLAQEDTIFIPDKATIHVEPIASRLLQSRNHLETQVWNQITLAVKEDVKNANCRGCSTIDDLQLSSLTPGKDFQRISQSKQMCTFKFSNISQLLPETIEQFEIVETTEEPIVVAFWWSINMYDRNLALKNPEYCINQDRALSLHSLSCAPTWARSDDMIARDKAVQLIYGRDVWREHWIQAIYYLPPRSIPNLLRKGDTLEIILQQDGFTFSFDCDTDKRYSVRDCELHRCISHSRLSMYSSKYMESLCANLVSFINKEISAYMTKVYVLTVESLILARILMKLPGVQSVSLSDSLERFGLERVFEVKVSPTRTEDAKILPARNVDVDCVVFDPYCDSESWIAAKHFAWIQRIWKGEIKTFPAKMVIKCALVNFKNLYRMSMKVYRCEGFLMEDLDELIGSATRSADTSLDAYYLWEFGGVRLSDDVTLFELDASGSPADVMSNQIDVAKIISASDIPMKIEIKTLPGCALAVWTDFHLESSSTVITSGPMIDCEIGAQIDWCRHWKQGVHFLHESSYHNYHSSREQTVDSSSECCKLTVELNLNDGKLKITNNREK